MWTIAFLTLGMTLHPVTGEPEPIDVWIAHGRQFTIEADCHRFGIHRVYHSSNIFDYRCTFESEI